MKGQVLARSGTPQMAKMLKRLELDRPLLIITRELDAMLQEEGIATPVAVFVARMREKGWLLPTGQRCTHSTEVKLILQR